MVPLFKCKSHTAEHFTSILFLQNGFLRIFDHANFESHGSMKSYFGGLIACAWSPDGRYIATGGEDDLVTVWSFYDKCVVARGTGHRSWISDINFDSYTCEIPSNEDMNYFYKLDSVRNTATALKQSCRDNQDSANNNPEPKSISLPGPSKNSDSMCNGDSIKSKKENNNVRKPRISRHSHKASVRLEKNAPSFCYRFGSVGQDSQLCLWELDENILFYSRLKTSVPVVNDDVSVSPSRELTEIQETDNSLNDSVSIVNGNDTSSEESSYPSPLRSTSVPNSIHSTTETSKKKKHSSQWGAISKFATIGAHDRSNKELKQQHKRNLSLPYFGLRSSSSQNAANKKNQESKNAQVIVFIYL